jgi:hypothetical protein
MKTLLTLTSLALITLASANPASFGQTSESGRTLEAKPAPTPNQIDHRNFLRRIVELESKLEALEVSEKTIERLESKIARLESHIEALEASAETTDTILTGSLPALGEIVARNQKEFVTWSVDAQKIIVWNNNEVKALGEALRQEQEWRTNSEPMTEWQYQRIFDIMRHQHAMITLQGYDLINACRRLVRGERSRSPIRRRGDWDGELEHADPNPFPPPVVNEEKN